MQRRKSWQRHRAVKPCEDRASITQLPPSAGEPGTAAVAQGPRPPLRCRRPHARPAPRCAGHLLLPAGAGAGALRRGWGRAKPSRRRHAPQLRPPSRPHRCQGSRPPEPAGGVSACRRHRPRWGLGMGMAPQLQVLPTALARLGLCKPTVKHPWASGAQPFPPSCGF